MELAIVGLGGIGASVGLAIRARRLPFTIAGYDLRPEVTKQAHARGILEIPCFTLEACANADMILLATPPSAMRDCLQALAPHLKPHTVLTDVASVKAPILAWAQQLLPHPQRFVGGHPVAGTEYSGLQAARTDLFEGAQWVLTPAAHTDPMALAQVSTLVQSIGAAPVLMAAEQHDREFALLSFLPHCVAFSLTALHRAHPTRLQGGSSWRDATRVAASDPTLWAELLLLNRRYTLEHLEVLINRLERLATLLDQGSPEPLAAYLSGQDDDES
ncbi:MAG: prephenate dehydrogenase [Fimbriimonadales bacterium]|nr:MAG: prephenate dehydrogenase [Fimbriimonadales bacterium]